jgi:hypothetical protein
MPSPELVFDRIDKELKSAGTYREALKLLEPLPPGYIQCFAFSYVDSDICNGGISQLYGNSTWALMPNAVSASDNAQMQELSLLLREIILYYHQKGRSKLKRQIGDDYFANLDHPMEKSLEQLEDEYFALDELRNQLIPRLCESDSEALWIGT